MITATEAREIYLPKAIENYTRGGLTEELQAFFNNCENIIRHEANAGHSVAVIEIPEDFYTKYHVNYIEKYFKLLGFNYNHRNDNYNHLIISWA